MSSAADALRDLLSAPSIAELITHPERVNDLPADVARTLLTQVLPLQMALLGRALAPESAGGGRDRLLTVKDAAAKLGQSREWLYRHARCPSLFVTAARSGSPTLASKRGSVASNAGDSSPLPDRDRTEVSGRFVNSRSLPQAAERAWR